MRVVLCSSDKKIKLELPDNVEGSFGIKDDLLNDNNLVNVNSKNGMWVLSSNHGVTIFYNGQPINESNLSLNAFYQVQTKNKSYVLFVEESCDNSFNVFRVPEGASINIGRDTNNNIVYNNGYIGLQHAILYFRNNSFQLVRVNSSLVYKNDIVLNEPQTIIHNGDVISIYSLRMIFCNNYLIINNPLNTVALKNTSLEKINLPIAKYQGFGGGEHVPENLYNDEDYFFKKPRLRRYIETYELTLASPPQKQENEEMPMLLVVGPSLTMGLISLVSAFNIINRLRTGRTTLNDSWPMLIMAGAMLLTSLLWPNLTRAYRKRKLKRDEEKRINKYHEYIDRKKEEIYTATIEQKSILEEQLLTTDQCLSVIDTKGLELWNRLNTQKDFLSVRIGRGDIPLDANINFAEDEFTLEEDELKKEAEKVVHEAAMLKDVPIMYSFKENKITAIMGEENKTIHFTKNILLQLATFYSYDDLKIVFLTNENNYNQWSDFKNLPHCFSNNKDLRFFATNFEEMQILDQYLCQEYIKRATDEQQREAVQTEESGINYKPNYLIITDDYSSVRKLNIDNLILEQPNLGFGFIVVENAFGQLPSECLDFINLGKEMSETLKNNSDEYITRQFRDEINYYVDYAKYCEILANIPVETEGEEGNIPETLSFLEMFQIGRVEQLNTLARWRQNDPTQSLRALVGVAKGGNKIYLDLHEKFHGPHGLIAGTTGSGKSEFIITYILSMALNYSPEEVSFILIDYKGGGLAGAFENKALNVRLPHLSGVITNLDKAELNRTLVSIKSELQRRQMLFNEARDELGESTIDIYKYQRFYREGKLKKPISHLFIISDEFAELKSQQPEFMDDLISTARIGRSLGVHLILATQKPSGVVNDQIWSNTKFRVCLKVQDRADSNGMLKKPDAAEIQNPGRFYLQVGYDELYVLGQSGYAGVVYKPSNQVVAQDDGNIVFIDSLGQKVREVSGEKPKEVINSTGDQLSNVLKYVTNMAKNSHLEAEKLWLDSIPADIYTDKLASKYSFDFSKGIYAILGEYDDPANQSQNILTLPLNSEGNTVVFGRNASDREMFVNTVLYSLCTRYSPQNINIYVLDFGSETLRVFSSFPQVGDVMFATDTEKVNKTFSIINDFIVERKNIFADYNGDYFNYCKNSGKTVPLLFFVINNWESFTENYSRFDDYIVRYSREGKRYGIILLITSSTSHGFPLRILRNFNNVYALELPNKADYMDLFGKIGNLYPSDLPGRGMCKAGNVCEFQTAQIYEGDDITSYLKQVAAKVKSMYQVSAPAIPVLPDKVTLDMLLPYLKGLSTIPIGIAKQSLKPYLYDFVSNKFTLISSSEQFGVTGVLETIITMAKKVPNSKIVLIDLERIMTSCIDIATGYCDKNFAYNTKSINDFTDKNIVNNQNNRMLFILAGVDKLLDANNKKALNDLITKFSRLDNVNIIIADSDFAIKKLTYEQWYSTGVRNNNGIWVGAGVAEQGVIKLSGAIKAYNEKINNRFAWVIRNGQGLLIKLMEMDEDEQ